jgi:hypothetical protein
VWLQSAWFDDHVAVSYVSIPNPFSCGSIFHTHNNFQFNDKFDAIQLIMQSRLANGSSKVV